MNELLILSLAGVLGTLILAVQLVRRRRGAGFDAVAVTGWLYFACFVVVPIFLHLVDLAEYHENAWRWMFFRRPFGDDGFVYASLIALAGYPLILAGARCGEALRATLTRVRRLPARLVDDQTPHADLLLAGVVTLAVGLAALLVYARSIGGFLPLVLEGLLFRGDDPPVVSRLAFLKNVSPLVLGASYCLFAIKDQHRTGLGRIAVPVLFWISFIAALIVLFHGAGRLVLIVYILTFPLAAMVQRGEWRWRGPLLLGALALGIVLFGKQVFVLRYGAEGVVTRWEAVRTNPARALKDVMVEFSFPYIVLANTTTDVPETVPYRYFSDLPLAGLYLVPQRVFGVRHPASLSIVNSAMVTDGGSGTIPVDLLSFGYFSLGLVGVALVALCFGAMLPLCERLFSGSQGAAFRVTIILFLAFRVMYADPVLVIQSGFSLAVTLGVLLLPRAVRQALPRGGPVRAAVTP